MEANWCSCTTASGELIPDHGGLRVKGTTEYGYEVAFRGRKTDVHTILVSASRVHSKGTALLQRSFDKSFNVRPYLESGTYIGHTQNQAIGAGAKQPRTLFSARETTVGGDFGTLRGVSPMASVGEVPSCPLAQSSAKKLQTRLVSRASGGMERMPIEKRNC